MAKMTVIYRTPENKASFDEHYFNIHIPLARRLPGLQQYEISWGPVVSPTGHADTYLVANLYFDSLKDIMEAFASEVGRQCAVDRKILAPGKDDVQIYLFDTKAV